VLSEGVIEMKNVFCVILLFFSIVILSEVEGFAQKADSIPFRKNVVYDEIIGNLGGLYSLNYERVIFNGDNGFNIARIGITSDFKGPGFRSVILINHVFSKYSNSHCEIGVGAILAVDNNYWVGNKLVTTTGFDTENSVPTANLMYRYQKPNGRFIFRVGWTPWIYPPDISTFEYLFICGISAGYAF